MNKSMLNGFALGNLTGLAACFILFTMLPDDWLRIMPTDSEPEPMPHFILQDFDNRLNQMREQLAEKEAEIAKLKAQLKERVSVESEARFIIDGEDRTEEYAGRFHEQRAGRVHSLVAELTGRLDLSRPVQSRLRELLSAELEKRGRHPYVTLSFNRGAPLREELDPLLTEAQQAELDQLAVEQRDRQVEERARAWLLQVESIVALDMVRREAVREVLRELVATGAGKSEGDFVTLFPAERALSKLEDILTGEDRRRIGELLGG